MKRITVIIVTWNGMKWILECLESLRASTIKVDIVVIDNGSTDNTVQFVRDNYPEVHLIQSEKNLGFGQANNIGMRYAIEHKTDYVYLLNQDAYVYPDMFENLLKVAENPLYSNYAVFSPLHVHGDKLSLDGQFKDYLKDIGPTIVEDTALTEMKEVYPVECIPAAGWLLPVKTLHDIGGFDPIFFHYGEDVHYAQRIKYHGYKIGLVVQAKMVHNRDGFGNLKAYKKDEIIRSQELYVFLDINNSSIRRWKMFVKNNLFFLTDVLSGNYRMMSEYIVVFCKVIYRQKRYRRNRKINKGSGGHWL